MSISVYHYFILQNKGYCDYDIYSLKKCRDNILFQISGEPS